MPVLLAGAERHSAAFRATHQGRPGDPGPDPGSTDIGGGDVRRLIDRYTDLLKIVLGNAVIWAAWVGAHSAVRRRRSRPGQRSSRCTDPAAAARHQPTGRNPRERTPPTADVAATFAAVDRVALARQHRAASGRIDEGAADGEQHLSLKRGTRDPQHDPRFHASRRRVVAAGVGRRRLTSMSARSSFVTGSARAGRKRSCVRSGNLQPATP